MSSNINKPVPVGCVMVAIGLIMLIPACIAFYYSHAAFSRNPPLLESGRALRIYGIAFITPAVLMVAWGIIRVLARLNVKKEDRGRFGTSLTD
jgi:hypothetical protein